MKKIKWKVRRALCCVEGYVAGELKYSIEGSLCVTVIEKGGPFPYKSYRITDVENGKEIAYDLLNGLNVEKHQANYEGVQTESARRAKFIQDVDEYLKKLKDEK